MTAALQQEPVMATLRVLSNKEAGGGARLLALEGLPGPDWPALGRFARLRAWEGPLADGGPLLDRPFSIHRSGGGRMEFLIRPVGPGSRRLASLRPGSPVRALGPLGRGLDVASPDFASQKWYLAAGGAGLAPMGGLCRSLGQRAMVFYGEREPSLQMSLEELLPESPGLPVAESGPGGALVTAPLEEALSRERRPVFACGPWPMLSAVARLAERFGAPFFASLEARMACGLGACLSCAAPLKGGGSLRVCKEGPVADGRLIDWEAFP